MSILSVMQKNALFAVPAAARRAFVAMVAAVVMVISLLGGAPAAQAQTNQIPSVEQLSSQFNVDKMFADTREQAWTTRNQWLQQISELNPQAAHAIKPALDAAIDAIFPGLIAQKEAEAKRAREAQERARAAEAARERARAEAAARRAEEQRRRNQFDRGSCPRDADVCVDIDGRRTWLQDDRGNVSYIATSMAPGRPGQETPRGTFWVNRKVKDEISYEFNNAPMPYAIYFTNNGHAFHQGSPATDSAGCVRLPQQDAIRYWNDLKIGDKVVIY